MNVKNYLEKYQQIPYKIFKNALERKSLSHAYLLIGEPVTPLFDITLFLAKSLICKTPNPFACDSCPNCKRVDERKYYDLFTFNEEGSSEIKKDAITDLIEEFGKAPFEKGGVKVYIINLVENMNEHSINSLLKFLEEPVPNVYAFLTTNNISKVLPTIISRCQTIKINPVPSEIIINEAIKEGVEKLDALLLANVFNAPEQIISNTSDNKYLFVKESLIKFLGSLLKEKEEAYYTSEQIMLNCLKDKNNIKLFFGLLSRCFEDIILIQNGNDPMLDDLNDILIPLSQKLKNADQSLIEIMKAVYSIQGKIKLELLIDHILNTILKETL